ncbi:hypothetical protein MTBUT4_370043 [Magnetospirillum sp. UT-4]|nr:hypothetical protein MTBUT4_370043 [Magnetospirillum sp. UT-4]
MQLDAGPTKFDSMQESAWIGRCHNIMIL